MSKTRRRYPYIDRKVKNHALIEGLNSVIASIAVKDYIK